MPIIIFVLFAGITLCIYMFVHWLQIAAKPLPDPETTNDTLTITLLYIFYAQGVSLVNNTQAVALPNFIMIARCWLHVYALRDFDMVTLILLNVWIHVHNVNVTTMSVYVC